MQNIELGEAYVFPKIDWTNGTVWFSDGEVRAGSRSRQLSAESDNAGFYKYVTSDRRFRAFLDGHSDYRLFGEWLVPHSLRTYKDVAWRRFYIFDVVVDTEEEYTYLPYNVYKPMLEAYDLDYIPAIAVIRNGSYEQFVYQLQKNVFLVQDGNVQMDRIAMTGDEETIFDDAVFHRHQLHQAA
ncbi:MAG: RNA ligase family protein [Bacteroidales bacterium]